MRLTLRTLLAYLDDTLPSEEAKLIGQKVAESSVAQELIERIKKVTRRRSLASPPVQGDTSRLDANTVAEYLDGVLAEDDLAQTEQICLDDDIYLAEVAACHQILTLMLSEPARVPPPARQRMYQLVKGQESIPNRKAPAFFPNGTPSPQLATDQDAHRRNRLPFALMLIVVLAVLLIVAVFLALPKSDSTQVAHRNDSGTRAQPVNAAPVPVVNSNTEIVDSKSNTEKPAETKKSDAASNTADSKKTSEPSKTTEAKKTVDASKSADSTKPDSPTPAVPVTGAPNAGGPGVPAAPKTNPESSKGTESAGPKSSDSKAPFGANAPVKKPLDVIPIEPPNEEIKDSASLISADCILAQRAGQENATWKTIRPNGRINSGVPIVCFPGYGGDLKLDGGLEVSMLSYAFIETIMTINVPPAKFNADLTLDHGRLVITNSQKDAPASVRLRFHSEVWDLTIAPQSQAFVDGLSVYDLGDRFSKQPGVESPLVKLFVSVPRGNATVGIRDNAPYELAAPPGLAIIGWDSRHRLAPPLKLPGPLPEWTADQEIRSAMKDGYKSVLASFLSRVAQPEASIELALKELAESSKGEAQAFAAYALAALDVIWPDVDALDDLLKPDMRTSAFLALRNWIARRSENSLALHQVLEQRKSYSENQADAVLQMLHSFSQADAVNPETYNQLFRWLNSEKLSIREMAFWHLEGLDPDGVKIAAYNPVVQEGREAAISRWRKRLTDGKIIPKPAKQSSPTVSPEQKPGNKTPFKPSESKPDKPAVPTVPPEPKPKGN